MLEKVCARVREIRQHKIFAVDDEEFYERLEKKQKDPTPAEIKFLLNTLKENS